MWSVELKIPAPAFAAFRRICGRPGVFWLDRAASGGGTLMGLAPEAQLWVWPGGEVRLRDVDGEHRLLGDPIEMLEEFVAQGDATPFPGDVARTIGFFAYDLAGLIEPRIRPVRSASPAMPLAWLARYDAVLACTPLDAGDDPPCRLTIHALDRRAGERLSEALRETRSAPAHVGAARLTEAPERDDHRRALERALAYIAAGDIYQVNLARRFRVSSSEDPGEVYLRLRAAQPVPYGAFLDCGDARVLCNSPERFLRVSGEEIATEPIKGTRPRHPDPACDRRLRLELQEDAKERAEHVMIVDLERSDLGRICTTGSVRVTSFQRVESFSTLHHLVSTVRGRLEPGVGLARILRATFPGGSITGAPKIRAAQVIAELEPAGRGLYTGALAWFRSSRDFDSAIAIRTAVASEGTYVYHAGGGIVADSDPDRELAECWLKAEPFLKATLGQDAAEGSREPARWDAERPAS